MIVPSEAELLLVLAVLKLLLELVLLQLLVLVLLLMVWLSGISAIYMFHNSSGVDHMDLLQQRGNLISRPQLIFSFISCGISER